MDLDRGFRLLITYGNTYANVQPLRSSVAEIIFGV